MATVIISVFVLTISAKLEVLEVGLALLEVVLDPDEELPVEESLELALDEDAPGTDSPGERSSSDAIVPVAGARSVVSDNAASSLFTVCSSSSTASSSSSTVVVVDEEEVSSASDS
ncbi:MAG: hypothetical protein ACLPY3_02505, partial [Solirubrobacteraceae bacterium]